MGTLNKRKIQLLLIDFLLLLLSCLAAYFIAMPAVGGLALPDALPIFGVFTACCLVFMIIFGTYKTIWRYAAVKDILFLAGGVSAGSLCSLLIILVFDFGVPGLLLYLMFLLSIGSYVGGRLLFQLYSAYFYEHQTGGMVRRERTMIVGEVISSLGLLIEMTAYDCRLLPVCIVNNDPEYTGRKVFGITVFGPVERVPELCARFRIENIIVVSSTYDLDFLQKVLDICSKTKCSVKVLPRLYETIKNKDLYGNDVKINVEKLIGRKPIDFESEDVDRFIRGKVCMVTGGGGSIGAELCRQIAKNQPEHLVIVDVYENNAYEIQQELIGKYGKSLPLTVYIASVRDFHKMERIFKTHRPDIVFHAAAYKHVTLMESNPEEAVGSNILGTFQVASLADFYRVGKFILVSTDKAVNPTNVMGATKRCCEMIMQYMTGQSDSTDFITVRFGNVLGSNGSVIPLFKKQIEAGGPVTITHPDIIRYFMTIPEAVSLILQAGAMAHGGEILVLDMGEPVRIVTLAENLIKQYGKQPYTEIPIEFIGLRPGEKLYEELLTSEEGLVSTMNNRIFIGNQAPVDPEEFIQKLYALKSVLHTGDRELIIKRLQDIVPNFTHRENGESAPEDAI